MYVLFLYKGGGFLCILTNFYISLLLTVQPIARGANGSERLKPDRIGPHVCCGADTLRPRLGDYGGGCPVARCIWGGGGEGGGLLLAFFLIPTSMLAYQKHLLHSGKV